MNKSTTNKKRILTRAAVVLLAFAVAFTALPIATSSLTVDAKSKPKKKITLTAAATSYTTVQLKWNKIKKPGKGYAVFRDGYVIAHVGKRYSFSDSGLAAATAYTYKVKAYKTKVKKTKMWYNKATGQYQKKKPAKRYRGKRKTFKKVTYKYSKASNAVSIRTAAPPAPAVVPVPQNLSVTVDGNALKIQWSPVDGATGYIVYVNDQKFEQKDLTVWSDGTLHKKITNLQNGTYTVQVSALKGSNESARSSGVKATVTEGTDPSTGEETKKVTDYLGVTRTITKKKDGSGTVYWEDESHSCYTESDLAKIDRTVDGEFTVSGGEVMVQKDGVTIKKTIDRPLTTRFSIDFYNGNPNDITFKLNFPEKTVSTYDSSGASISVTYLMSSDGKRLIVKNGETVENPSGSGSPYKKIVDFANRLYAANDSACVDGTGFCAGNVTVTAMFKGEAIASTNFTVNPNADSTGLAPIRKAYLDFAEDAVKNYAEGGASEHWSYDDYMSLVNQNRQYEAEMRSIQWYIWDNCGYHEQCGLIPNFTCTTSSTILETYSIVHYNRYGHQYSPPSNPDDVMFRTDDDTALKFPTSGHGKDS